MTAEPTLKVMDLEECRGLLSAGRFGRLGVVVDGQPLILPVNYRFQGNTLVFRTNRRTKLAAGDFSRVAFEVDGVDPDGRSGWSVLVQGRAYEITDSLDTNSERLRKVDVPSAVRDSTEPLFEIIADNISGRHVGRAAREDAPWPLDPVFVTRSALR